MAGKRTALGKGIDSMIPGAEKITKTTTGRKTGKSAEEPKEGILMMDINKVEPNKNQPRKQFNVDRLQELAESIKQHGIVEPLVVVKRDKFYEIVAGERRWRAAKSAGIKEIPVVVKEYTDQQIVEIALIENIQREDLNPIEEARAYEQLIKEYSLKQDEVAEKVSKSRTAITNSLRLLNLDTRVQDMLIDECISSGHARALLAIEDGEEQYELAMQIFDNKLSVRDTEKLVKKIKNKDNNKKPKEELQNVEIYSGIEEKLKLHMGTKVTINRKNNTKGKIEIEYYSEDELDRIVAMMTK